MNIGIRILFLFVITVNGQSNCSTYNPCGRYGYCRDNDDGNSTCECKFWWNGTLCDEQTNSGTQVIVLGCMLGVLMLIFYGLNIGRSIRDRRRKPKEIEKNEIARDPPLIDVAFKTAKRSARLPSCITAVLVIIVTNAALVAEWGILQPIHNEIVQKYQTNQSLYYQQKFHL